MKAAQYNSYGGTEVIEINEHATVPQPSEKQILVEVYAASINPVEASIRKGLFQQMLLLHFPVNLGGDFSGVVKEVGKEVTEFTVGDEVYGVANPFKGGSGSVAEFAVKGAESAAKKPKTIDHLHAASLPLVGASALQALKVHMNLQPDQKILIHGGAGGIGTIAIQAAKMFGAYVATTASGENKEFLQNLGADEVIDYKTQDFTTMISEYDAVFDTVGGEITNKSITVLKKGGILVSMAGQADAEMVKQQGITAITQMTDSNTLKLTKLAEHVDSGDIKPVVDSTFSLEQTREAYDLLETGHPKGKVVIKIK